MSFKNMFYLYVHDHWVLKKQRCIRNDTASVKRLISFTFIKGRIKSKIGFG